MSERATKAKEYFQSGYNCAQSVLMAFADMTSLFDSAVFTGDLVTGRITIDPEVTFNATCRMFQKEERKKLLESL